ALLHDLRQAKEQLKRACHRKVERAVGQEVPHEGGDGSGVPLTLQPTHPRRLEQIASVAIDLIILLSQPGVARREGRARPASRVQVEGEAARSAPRLLAILPKARDAPG